MAAINVSVQSILNTAVYTVYASDTLETVASLKARIATALGINTLWFDLKLATDALSPSNTIASYAITNGTVINVSNKIARLATREDRQVAKLKLAELKRIASGSATPTANINLLPSKYVGNVSTDNGAPLQPGRPWIA